MFRTSPASTPFVLNSSAHCGLYRLVAGERDSGELGDWGDWGCGHFLSDGIEPTPIASRTRLRSVNEGVIFCFELLFFDLY